MGTIVISDVVSLDGVVQDPTGEEDFGRGGWFLEVGDDDRAAWAQEGQDAAMRTEALLLGRRSDEWFAQRWSTRTGEWADRLNGLPKYVVSSTLDDGKWNNSTILRGDLVADVTKLKQQHDGDIVVFASAQLAHALLEQDLVDEVRLTVYPVLCGDGERLFGSLGESRQMRLIDSHQVGEGLAFLAYEVVRER